jgi:hypothetical protein
MTNIELPAELKAMAQIETAMKDLADDERARVLQWVLSRFRGKGTGKPLPEVGGNEEGSTDLSEYSGLSEFYEAAAAASEMDRALVVAYWYQFKEGATDVEAQKVNAQLKNLGHGVGNITRAFDALKSQKPALIIQTRKEGTSKQARKKYRVTGEGKKAVERLIAATSG